MERLATAAGATGTRGGATARALADGDAPGEAPSGLHRNLHWIGLAAFLVVIAAYVLALQSLPVYPIVLLGALAAGTFGIRLHQPEVRWPWVLFAVGVGVLTVAAALNEALNSDDGLDPARILYPDVVSLGGYAVIAVALYGLMRTRGNDPDRSALLDGILLATAQLLTLYELVGKTAVRLDTAPADTRLMVVAFPAASVVLVALAVRLAFAGGQSVAFRFVLAGVFTMHLGDVGYALSELGRIDVSEIWMEVPYLLATSLFAVAVLHPSLRMVARDRVTAGASVGRVRTIAVTAALAAPATVLALHIESLDHLPEVVFAFMLVAAAVARITSAMQHQARSADQLYHRATHDDLTGLPGRALLLEHLDDRFADPAVSRVSLMFVDLDRFKQVNDSMGHHAGDELLQLVATRIARVLRNDDRLFRLSGDEFVIVALNTGESGAEALASRIREVARAPFQLSVGEVFLSASVGVSSAPTSDRGRARTMLGEADEAMYASKQAGRDATSHFNVEMRERTERRIDLERMLHVAIDERQLEVHYQPIVTGSSWRINGFEALARWTVNGERIGPNEFIPVAEESGLIVPLGRFVLDEACRQLATWRRFLPGAEGCTMSVNVSARQIRTGDIVDVVADVLRRHQLPGDALWLEITESVMVEDSVTTGAVLAAMRALGVRLSIDDFGTGFSSLSYLKRFPVSRVKIDRAFVNGVSDDESDRSLVAAVIAMAGALGLETVSEGVERPEQAFTLRDLGCETMQGFLFGRPAPAHEITELIEVAGLGRTDSPGGRTDHTGAPSDHPG